MTKQLYKSVYFSDHPGKSSKERSITLAFSSEETELYELVRPLSSDETRNLIGIESFITITKLAQESDASINKYCINQLKRSLREDKSNHNYQLTLLPDFVENEFLFDPITVTFKGGKSEPFNRWYPLIEGYSPSFVKEIIQRYHPKARRLLDPFSGTGSSVIAASEIGKVGYYCELNPVLQYATNIKLLARGKNYKLRNILADKLQSIRSKLEATISNYDEDVSLKINYLRTFNKSQFFPTSNYKKILRLRTMLDRLSETEPVLSQLVTVAVLKALVPASNMKRAGDLRYKTKKEKESGIPDIIKIINENLRLMILDLRNQSPPLLTNPVLLCEDASKLSKLPPLNLDIIVTSPPYVNGTNYFRNTKIELWFLRSVSEADDLRRFRNRAVTAGINDVRLSDEKKNSLAWLTSIILELEKKAYDRRIPRMIEEYFNDLYRIFANVRHHLNHNSILAIDIGDSEYAGVHIPSDHYVNLLLNDLGFTSIENIPLRSRRSRSGTSLVQSLLVFRYSNRNSSQYYFNYKHSRNYDKWTQFKKKLPHQTKPFSKRNWGHPRHSLCSYQGKLKPSIAHHLVDAFVPAGGSVLDPFAGVGTIPFEAALQGKQAFGFEISPAAFYIAHGKLSSPTNEECMKVIKDLSIYLSNEEIQENEIGNAQFGLNGSISEFFHKETLKEILLARRYFKNIAIKNSAESFVLACLLHVLHGNRPYALSRRSHPITPYKPSGEYSYKSLITSLTSKVERMMSRNLPENYVPGKIFFHDAASWWPAEVQDLDAIITSPPFFDSTRFYAANWIRLWFAGWEPTDFKHKPLGFLDERQKKSFDVYIPIFRQIRERLKPNGIVLLHLGKSKKCDMATHFIELSKPWFRVIDRYYESVKHVESHGIKDKGGTSIHQYLVLR